MLTRLRNLITHIVHEFESRKKRSPQGRHRKLSTSYILDRIFYVCKTGDVNGLNSKFQDRHIKQYMSSFQYLVQSAHF